jgi:hypothetical protein
MDIVIKRNYKDEPVSADFIVDSRTAFSVRIENEHTIEVRSVDYVKDSDGIIYDSAIAIVPMDKNSAQIELIRWTER